MMFQPPPRGTHEHTRSLPETTQKMRRYFEKPEDESIHPRRNTNRSASTSRSPIAATFLCTTCPRTFRAARARKRHVLGPLHQHRRPDPQPQTRRPPRRRRAHARQRPAQDGPLISKTATSTSSSTPTARCSPRRTARRSSMPASTNSASPSTPPSPPSFRWFAAKTCSTASSPTSAASARCSASKTSKPRASPSGSPASAKPSTNYKASSASPNSVDVREIYLQRLVFFTDNSEWPRPRRKRALREHHRAKKKPHPARDLARSHLGIIFNASGATEPGTSIKKRREPTPHGRSAAAPGR